VLDHAWGHGILASDYENSAGRLEGSYKDEQWHHFVVALRRRMGRGDVLQFRVRREARAGFLQPEGWLESTMDHPIAELRPSVVFPKDRPCRWAVLEAGAKSMRLRIHRYRDGRTAVHVRIPRPRPFVRYTIRWRW